MKIHHISNLAANANTNQHFYTSILGLRLVKNTVNQENFRIRHLFYGDYEGTPGTVITFFVVPLLGRRTDGNHFIGGMTLAIPEGSIDWWHDWLVAHQLEVSIDNGQLSFTDPDQMKIVLAQTDTILPVNRQVPNNKVPGKYQITGILGTNWSGPNTALTSNFFHRFINAATNQQNKIVLSDDQFIQLVQAPADAGRTRFGRGSIDHLALQVNDEIELFDFWQLAVSQGWQLEMYRDRTWFKSIYLRDPSDNRLELATLSPGFSVDEPLANLGEKLTLPQWLEPKRAEIEAELAKQS
ncbi:VOC family protein [Paucilactobacillus kaifaensis]|uniref:VOC family protein n=1 Tax=Paucilactobacillus kaifaensis TaxID=2559921 RepID=UPI0010F565E9|nr:VOC family protein [Paucilactobacillus kaifaensis]